MAEVPPIQITLTHECPRCRRPWDEADDLNRLILLSERLDDIRHANQCARECFLEPKTAGDPTTNFDWIDDICIGLRRALLDNKETVDLQLEEVALRPVQAPQAGSPR